MLNYNIIVSSHIKTVLNPMMYPRIQVWNILFVVSDEAPKDKEWIACCLDGCWVLGNQGNSDKSCPSSPLPTSKPTWGHCGPKSRAGSGIQAWSLGTSESSSTVFCNTTPPRPTSEKYFVCTFRHEEYAENGRRQADCHAALKICRDRAPPFVSTNYT
jgi:hypothetical protein